MKEMMRQPDQQEFIIAMKTEVQQMFEKNIWKNIMRSEIKEHYNTIRNKGQLVKREKLYLIWSFKQKCLPDGTLLKYKARLCCHEGQQ